MAGEMVTLGAAVLNCGYEITPIVPGTKNPRLEEWQKGGFRPNGPTQDSIGLLTRETPAIDCDTLDEALAERMRERIDKRLENEPPIRVGQWPKFAALCRSDKPFRKMSSLAFLDPQGRKAQLEILGDGQQLVGYAVHPDTGRPYVWESDYGPAIVPVADLPRLNPDIGAALIAEFEADCRAQGWPLKSNAQKALPITEDDELLYDGLPLGLSDEAIEVAVADVPNNNWEYEDGYPCWIGMLQSIANETGKSDFGHDVALEWSCESGKHEAKRFETTWNSLENYPGRKRTFRYVLKLARFFRPKPAAAGKIINPVEWQGVEVPPRQFLIEDWIPIGRATGFYGEGGAGKTLLAQMLVTACALAFTRPDVRWLGLPVKPVRSYAMWCENDRDELHSNQELINRHYDCSFAELEAMRFWPRFGEENRLATTYKGGVEHTALCSELLYRALGHGAELVIVDTISDTFDGDENDRNLARQFVQQVYGYLAREINGATLPLAHPSVAGVSSGTMTSGSTGWKNTFRSFLALMSEPGEGQTVDRRARRLQRMKSNWAEPGAMIDMRWQDGVFVRTSPVVEAAEAPAARTVCDNVFLDLLDRMAREGQHLSSKPNSGNYAPRIFAKRPDGKRFTKGDFEAAMYRLFAAGLIVVAPYRDGQRHPQEGIPIGICHPCQHDRLPQADLL